MSNGSYMYAKGVLAYNPPTRSTSEEADPLKVFTGGSATQQAKRNAHPPIYPQHTRPQPMHAPTQSTGGDANSLKFLTVCGWPAEPDPYTKGALSLLSHMATSPSCGNK